MTVGWIAFAPESEHVGFFLGVRAILCPLESPDLHFETEDWRAAVLLMSALIPANHTVIVSLCASVSSYNPIANYYHRSLLYFCFLSVPSTVQKEVTGLNQWSMKGWPLRKQSSLHFGIYTSNSFSFSACNFCMYCTTTSACVQCI